MSRRERAEKERMGQRAGATGRPDGERVSERAREGGAQGTHRAGAHRERAKYGDLSGPCTRFRARDPVRESEQSHRRSWTDGTELGLRARSCVVYVMEHDMFS